MSDDSKELYAPNQLFYGNKAGLPVKCLGHVFKNETERRLYFADELRKHLKDPNTRAIAGFPTGKDEDIIAASDPPYYTACPNPWVLEFVKEWSLNKESNSNSYHREPFATDVSEGKSDPVYGALAYHTKVPHKAVMRYILHYTNPGDVILDGFCGTGMAGVAAQMCGSRDTVESLGYRVEGDGCILDESTGEDDGTKSAPFSKLGTRRAIMYDLSPAATYISSAFNTPVSLDLFDDEAARLLKDVENECSWMFRTVHTAMGGTRVQSDLEQLTVRLNGCNSSDEILQVTAASASKLGTVNYTLMSDVFVCPDCSKEVVFWEACLDAEAGKVLDEFPCPYCDSKLSKRNMERAWESFFDPQINSKITHAKQQPVLINYSFGGKRYQKKPDFFDILLLEKISTLEIPYWFPSDRMMDGRESRRNDGIGVTHVHHFFTKRNLWVIAAIYEKAKSNFRLCLPVVFNMFTRANKQSSLHVSNFFKKGGGVCKGHLTGTLYIPSISPEIPATKILKDRIDTYRRGKRLQGLSYGNTCISTQSTTNTRLPDASIDYIFVDPPFGANLNYSELNWNDEAWIRVSTNIREEAIENETQGKGLDDYRYLMVCCFKEAYRVLKPGRWMTVEFSNTKASVWNSIQTALVEAGFIIANVSALDKQQGSFKAVNTPTAVKQDLVISAYKPNGGFEERFQNEATTEEGVWDFARTHLQYLPRYKSKLQVVETITERDPRIIYDRMVSFYVKHGLPVPLSSQEFQAGMLQRFEERDGMIFLADQVAEYDRKRMLSKPLDQQSLFVSDERTAIDWLQSYLKAKPSTYAEVNINFMPLLNEAGWKKYEARPELALLLDQNFLKYNGLGDVPSQIHSYLSTNFRDFRNLPKDSQQLKLKAKDRWYVPDPNKAQECEQLREKALLKEFETYRVFTGRKLKAFRLEAVRAGFRKAWSDKDYQTIISIAKKVPDDVLQEDPKLTILYDGARTRMGE